MRLPEHSKTFVSFSTNESGCHLNTKRQRKVHKESQDLVEEIISGNQTKHAVEFHLILWWLFDPKTAFIVLCVK